MIPMIIFSVKLYGESGGKPDSGDIVVVKLMG
jgi:hypothetical protein